MRIVVPGIYRIGEKGEKIGDRAAGRGGIREEDLRSVGIVPGAFLGVGEDFVGVEKLLELGRSVGLG